MSSGIGSSLLSDGAERCWLAEDGGAFEIPPVRIKQDGVPLVGHHVVLGNQIHSSRQSN